MILAPAPGNSRPPTTASPTSPTATPAPGPRTIDEKTAIAQYRKLQRLVLLQSLAIGALGLIFALFVPFAAPTYVYYAMKPDKKVLRLVGLDMPNMTNRAVLAWATTSITEIMTMGFGDIDSKLAQQKWRFTRQGWDAYDTAFVKTEIGTKFKQNQLVLTTAPSNTPVIVGQGVNPDGIYQWNVQMPVIMTYATNNNASHRQRNIVSLSIIRVPAEESSAGIAIQNWNSGS